jgi:hypothetical protein
MNNEPFDPLWERLSNALFGVRKMSDEAIFTARVMMEIRQIQEPRAWELAWPRFWRWAVPVLGVGVASLVLATRTPLLFFDEGPTSALSEIYP